jgi:hypothetical protein
MRTRLFAIPLALVLVLASAGLAAADTTPPSGDPGGLDVMVTSTSINAKTGLVTVSGAVTCDVDFDYVGVEAGIAQVVGRLNTLRGWGYTDTGGCLAADGSTSFTFSFYADSGRFAPGKAMISISAWGEGNCTDDLDTGEWNCENWGSASYGPTAIRLGKAR